MDKIDISSLSKEQIIFGAKDIIEKFKTDNSYLLKSGCNFDKIALSAVTQAFNEYDGTENFNKLVVKNLRTTIITYIRRNSSNEDMIKQVLLEYIETKFDRSNTYKSAIENINKLFYRMRVLQCSTDVMFLSSLLVESSLLNQAVYTFFLANRNRITFVQESFAWSFSVTLIFNLYCDMNHISVCNPYYESNSADKLSESEKLYIDSIPQTKLSQREEKKLFLKLALGDKDARQKIINNNLKYVVFIASYFRNYGVPFLDLVQEGNIALVETVDKFDSSYNVNFSSYAYFSIRRRIIKTIYTYNRQIQKPPEKLKQINDYIRKINDLSNRIARDPYDVEIANEFGMSLSEVRNHKVFNEDVVYLEDYSEEDDIFAIDDESISSIVNKISREEVFSLFEKCKLSEREIIILKYRFGLEDGIIYTLNDIGLMFGLTSEAIRIAEIKAIKKLRKMRNIKMYASYLDYPEQSLINLKKLKRRKNNYFEMFDCSRASIKGSNISLYLFFSDYTNEQINYVLNNLCEKDYSLLQKKFGIDFSGNSTEILTNEENNYLENIIYPCIRKMLSEIGPISNNFETVRKRVTD